ncbi:hypothetical protein L596_013346 [Steinernema carpocapsae]|uniref:Uncharacterized protein n=1 Tax=Steinernema carpocapsae TaxID=34508 RepID=A0A4U5NZV2_STECR|nr:hypothetical protein L596_013346 [Steinernema carpocapsae]
MGAKPNVRTVPVAVQSAQIATRPRRIVAAEDGRSRGLSSIATSRYLSNTSVIGLSTDNAVIQRRSVMRGTGNHDKTRIYSRAGTQITHPFAPTPHEAHRAAACFGDRRSQGIRGGTQTIAKMRAKRWQAAYL